MYGVAVSLSCTEGVNRVARLSELLKNTETPNLPYFQM
jgi:hypothetical protein